MTASTALTIIAHSRVRSTVAPISLAVLGCLVDAVLWFVAVSVVHSIVLVAMCVDVKVGHLSGPSCNTDRGV